jgi:hypothetical protein
LLVLAVLPLVGGLLLFLGGHEDQGGIHKRGRGEVTG